MALTQQQEAELEFWRGLVAAQGEFYYAYRVAEYYEKVRYFPSFLKQDGLGADIGCGCISVFEGSRKAVVALDALAKDYSTMIRWAAPAVLHCPIFPLVDELIDAGDEHYEWIACINMIDHTPNPEDLLREIHRVLKPEGRMYFEVNLEAGLAPPHYQVWTAGTVHAFESLGLFRETFRYIQDVPEHNQRRYWAEFQKV